MNWLKNKQWLDIVGGLRAYKGMIMAGDPDSGSFPDSPPTGGNAAHSFQDQERERHRGTEVTDLIDAQVVTSETLANPFLHKVLLDLDVPAVLIPSTTPGHSHLYIDVDVPWEKLVDMLDAMAEAGVLEKGFVKAARARGFSTLRTPWTKKPERVQKKVRPGRGALGSSSALLNADIAAADDRDEWALRQLATDYPQINPAWPPLSEEERQDFHEPGWDSGTGLSFELPAMGPFASADEAQQHAEAALRDEAYERNGRMTLQSIRQLSHDHNDTQRDW